MLKALTACGATAGTCVLLASVATSAAAAAEQLLHMRTHRLH
jgi:hypothetical protein